MGVFFLLTPFVPRLNQEWRPDALIRRAGAGGPIIAGLAFAVAWTPCVGPTLASILAAASTSDTVAHGGVLLAFYSLGLAVPFLLTAVAFDRATTAFGWIREHYMLVTAALGLRAHRHGHPDPHRRADAAQRPGPEGAEQPGPRLPLQDLAAQQRSTDATLSSSVCSRSRRSSSLSTLYTRGRPSSNGTRAARPRRAGCPRSSPPATCPSRAGGSGRDPGRPGGAGSRRCRPRRSRSGRPRPMTVRSAVAIARQHRMG